MCRTVSKGPHFPYVCEDCVNPPRPAAADPHAPKPDPPPAPPLKVFGIPVRLDATLCAPDELWIEQPDGEAVRVWPPTRV